MGFGTEQFFGLRPASARLLARFRRSKRHVARGAIYQRESGFAMLRRIFSANMHRSLMFQNQSGNDSDRLATRESVRRRMTWDRNLPEEERPAREADLQTVFSRPWTRSAAARCS